MHDDLPMQTNPSPAKKSFWTRPLFIVPAVLLGLTGAVAAGGALWYDYNFHASKFLPISLTGGEKAELDTKLVAMSVAAEREAPATAPVNPEEAKRTLTLSDREINAFLAAQGLGEQLKVELGTDGGSATFILPVEQDAPVLAGKTLRIKCDFKAAMDPNKKLAFSISDLSVGGVPMPNAWLGGLKGLNLLNNADLSSEPAVSQFVAGIKDLSIAGGALKVILNE